jgi:hypothetical protein
MGDTHSGNMQPWQRSEEPESHALSTSNHDALGINVLSPEINNWDNNNSAVQDTGGANDTFASTAWSNTLPNNTSRPTLHQESTFSPSAAGWGSHEPEHRSPTDTVGWDSPFPQGSTSSSFAAGWGSPVPEHRSPIDTAGWGSPLPPAPSSPRPSAATPARSPTHSLHPTHSSYSDPSAMPVGHIPFSSPDHSLNKPYINGPVAVNASPGHNRGRLRLAAEDNVPDRFELFLLGDDEKKVTEETDTRKFIFPLLCYSKLTKMKRHPERLRLPVQQRRPYSSEHAARTPPAEPACEIRWLSRATSAVQVRGSSHNQSGTRLAWKTTLWPDS